MKILLVRHAEAVPSERMMDDASRWLTQAGRSMAQAQGARLAKTGVSLSYLWTSPLVRAVQTAERMAHSLSFEGEIGVLSELHPDHGTTRQLVSCLTNIEPEANVMWVSHMPKVCALVSDLTGIEVPPFRTSQVVQMAFNPSEGLARLEWSLEPSSGRFLRH